MPDEEPYGGFPWPYALTKFQVEELMHAYASEVHATKHTPSTRQAHAKPKPKHTPTPAPTQAQAASASASANALTVAARGALARGT